MTCFLWDTVYIIPTTVCSPWVASWATCGYVFMFFLSWTIFADVICSCVHLFVRSLIDWYSFIRSFVRSFVHSLMHSFMSITSFILSCHFFMNSVLEWGSSMGESQYLWEPCPEWIIHEGSKLLATTVGKPFMWTGADADPAQKKMRRNLLLPGGFNSICKCILYHAGNTLIWHRFCGLPTVRQPQVGRMNSTSPVANWSSPW